MSLPESFKREFLLGSGKPLDHYGQVIGFFKNGSGGRLVFLRLHSGLRADCITQQNRLKCEGRLECQVILDRGVQYFQHLGQHRLLVFDVGDTLVKLGGSSQLRLQALGVADVAHQFIRRGKLLGMVNNRLGFLDRQLEMTVALHFLLGVGPPFFPVLLDDIRHQRLLNLRHGGPPAEALEHQLDQLKMVPCSRALQPGQVGGLACLDMTGTERLENRCRKPEIHRVARLGLEVDGDLGHQRIHRGNLPGAPRAVSAKTGCHQLRQRIR